MGGSSGNPTSVGSADSSVNMEGKETRFGVLVSNLFAVVVTTPQRHAEAVNAMHDSFTAHGRYGADIG